MDARRACIMAVALGLLLGCGDDPSGPGEPVPVTITPDRGTVVQQGSVQLSAFDAQGDLFTGGMVTWTSSDPGIAAISTDGLVSALLPGEVTITATSEGKSGSTTFRVIAGIITGIGDIRAFLDRCPTTDPAYATIRADFELREDGNLLPPSIDCVEPFSTLPVASLTDELIAVQVLRTAYYMSQGTEGRLPWTTKSLYAWMKDNVAGINFKTEPGRLYCCDVIEGRLYFSTSRQEPGTGGPKRTWPGISESLTFFAHEIRHADAGSPGHVSGCAALGCDATYDLSDLGAYGVQYWLTAGWTTGSVYIGIVCAPAKDQLEYLESTWRSSESLRSRFVMNAPPSATPVAAYGAPCGGP